MFTLANINVKNKVLTSKYDGGEMSKILSHIIKERQIDIICAEKVTPNYVENLCLIFRIINSPANIV